MLQITKLNRKKGVKQEKTICGRDYGNDGYFNNVGSICGAYIRL